jgi:hypothetical protein
VALLSQMSDIFIRACNLEPPLDKLRRRLVLDEITGIYKVIGTFVEIDIIKVLFEFAFGSVKRHSNDFFNYDNSSFVL